MLLAIPAITVEASLNGMCVYSPSSLIPAMYLELNYKYKEYTQQSNEQLKFSVILVYSFTK